MIYGDIFRDYFEKDCNKERYVSPLDKQKSTNNETVHNRM